MNQVSKTRRGERASAFWTKACRMAIAALAALSFGAAFAQSQAVTQPFNYARTSAFSYYTQADGVKEGLLKSETVEPDNGAACVTTTYGYDDYGNRVSSVTAQCTGSSAPSVTSSFGNRGSSATYGAIPQQSIVVSGTPTNVAVPRGTFATAVANAASHAEGRTFDPRFGTQASVTGPNGLTTSWSYDDFGRKTREQHADGTSIVTMYCLLAGSDISSNSAGCGSQTYASGEMPTGAFMVVQTEPHDTSDHKIGAYQRVFTDAEGRKLRVSTEAFDGAGQPTGATGNVVVQDTVYSAVGVAILTTQPYFLKSSSSMPGGSQDVGATYTQYDILGRPTQVFTADTVGSQVSVAFGSWGSRRASLTTISYAGTSSTTTDDLGRTHREDKDINGNVILVTDATGAQLARQYDAFAQLVQVKDALQNLTALTYDVRGNKLSLLDPDSGLTTSCYDALGQLKAQQTAKMRGGNSPVPCPSDIDNSTTAKPEAGWTTMAYDGLGRLRQRLEPEDLSKWAYDTYLDGSACPMGTGKLCESNSNVGTGHRYAFDSFGRPVSSSITTNAAGTAGFAGAVTYEAATGRLRTKTYPSGLQVQYDYTTAGYLSAVRLATQFTVNPLPHTAGAQAGAQGVVSSGTALWQATTMDAWGRTVSDLLGNGVTDRTTFDASTGRPTMLLAGVGATGTGALNLGYSWDSLGRISTRTDSNGAGDGGAVVDAYQYDGVDRLTQYTVQAPGVPGYQRTVTMQYNAIGNLLYKSDVGTYGYAAYGNANGVTNPLPHAVATVTDQLGIPKHYAYDAGGNLTSVDGGGYRSLSYTSFDLPDSSTGMAGSGSSPRYTYIYDENHQRIKEMRTDASGTQVTWFVNPDGGAGLSFESETTPGGVVNNRHYISAGSQIVVFVTASALPALGVGQTAPTPVMTMVGNKVEYWHKDFLGNLTTTTNHVGTVTAYYSFDPFGKRRYPGGAYDASGGLVVPWSTTLDNGTGRGFTGHEQIGDLGIVHMNGRLFDPTIGRFMQADPLLQLPHDLQNYNRYSYCLNNPITCTDPSGMAFFKRILDPDPNVTGPAWIEWHLPLEYVSLKKVAHNRVGYQVGSIAIAVVAAVVCEGWATAGCEAIGAAGWATFAGASSWEADKAGAIAGVTALASYGVGTAFPGAGTTGATNWSVAMNTVGHAAVGCASARLSGGSCGSGAAAGFVSAAWSNYGGGDVSGHSVSAIAENTVVHATVGGVASVAGGGSFWRGAASGAFDYLFNTVQHWRAVEQLTAEFFENQGYDVVRGVKIVLKGLPGELDTYGIADYIATKDGQVIIGEVKDGLGSKLSSFQRALAGDASALQRLVIVNAEKATALNLEAGTMLVKQLGVGAKLTWMLDAQFGSRAAATGARMWGADAMAVRIGIGALRVFGSVGFVLLTTAGNE